MPQHSLDDYALAMHDEEAMADDLAALLDEMAEYAEPRHRDEIVQVLARYRALKETRL
jgi:hypothetical protein